MSILDHPALQARRQAHGNADEELFAHVVAACQRLHRQGLPLTVDTLAGEMPELGTIVLEHLLGSEALATALAERGIAFTPLQPLTAKQMAAAAIYLDTTTSMTHSQRLRAAGVSQRQWDGWMAHARFNALVFEMSEERLAASVPNAHMALMRAVDEGKPWAIKLFYEVSGRHNPAGAHDDVPQMLAQLLQILDDSGVPVDVMRQVGEKMVALSQNPSAAATISPRQAMIVPESGRGPL